MQLSEHTTRAAQRETDHQRWADEGGFIPAAEQPVPPVAGRSPWRVIGIPAALGFAIGWLTSPGPRGVR